MRDQGEYKWVEVADFSPGIVDPSVRAGARDPAPLGSAVSAVGCLPAGAPGAVSLVPGWKKVAEVEKTPYNDNWTSHGHRPPEFPDQVLCDTGMWSPAAYLPVSGGPNNSRPDQLFWGYVDVYNAAGVGDDDNALYKHFFTLGGEDSFGNAVPTATTDSNAIFLGRPVTEFYVGVPEFYAAGGVIAMGRSFQYDRSAKTFSSAVNNSAPVVVWCPITTLRTDKFDARVFPDLDQDLGNTTTVGTFHTTDDQMMLAPVFHGGRFVWSPRHDTPYQTYNEVTWTPQLHATALGQGGMWDADAPIGTLTQLIFGDQHDLHAWSCSINATTLLVMTSSTGAYLIRGDLGAPQVTRLAGATAAMYPFSRPAQVGNTVVYATPEGVFVTNEAGETQSISAKLSGKFWVPDGAEDCYARYAPTGKMCHRDPWILAPNSYIFDKDTQSWWQLPAAADDDTPPYSCYEVSSTGQVYAFPWYRNNDTHVTYVRFDPSESLDSDSDTWTWESGCYSELRPLSNAKVREIQCELSGFGVVTVEVHAGSSVTYCDFEIDSATPVLMRGNAAVRTSSAPTADQSAGAAGIYFTLEATGMTGDGALPSVHRVRLGYQERGTIAS